MTFAPTYPSELMLKLADEVAAELNLKQKEIDEIDKKIEEYLDVQNYEKIELTYYGEPKAQPRARATGNLNHFYDPGKSFKLFIHENISSQLGNVFKTISKDIIFQAKYYKPYPKSTPRKDKVLMEVGAIRPLNKPDLDNYEKLLYDALLNLLYTDDSVVVRGEHEKFYSCKPRVEITIYFRK